MKKFLLLIYLIMAVLSAQQQLLLNGSFEEDENSDQIPDHWGGESFHNSFVRGIDGQRALKIELTEPGYAIGNQIIKIKDPELVSISCWIKADNIVPGDQPWKNAKLQVLFYDQQGQRLGGYPEVVAFSGDFDWEKAARTLQVPAEAVEMHILPGIWEATGAAYFDNVQLEIIEQEELSDPENHLSNGSLETLDDWSISSAKNIRIVYPGYQGNGALMVKSEQHDWIYAVQTLKLRSAYKKIELSGYIKSEEIVPGKEPWQLARMYLEFKDKNGNLLALPDDPQQKYPVVVSRKEMRPWEYFEKQFLIPQQAESVYVMAGLQKASGTVYFDELKVKFLDAEDDIIKKDSSQQTEKSDWFALKPVRDSYSPSALDASDLLHKPAGKYGFVTASKGHFYFENEKRARFLGVNIYGEDCFPDKRAAELTARRIAKHGFNLVRLHHLDAPWARPNIFGNNPATTRKLDADSLSRLDYFIYQLKKQGIYIYLDLLVHRKFLEADNVRDADLLREGAKVSAIFDEQLITLQKEYARQLLRHKNRYTGLRYVDEPAIALTAIVNENSIFYLADIDWLPKSYLKQIDHKWNIWLMKQYTDRQGLQKAWAEHSNPEKLKDQEDPKKFTVARGKTPLKKDNPDDRINVRDIDTLRFYYQLQLDYFEQMSEYLRELGFKGVLAGSNHWLNIDADVKSNTILDFIDRHAYWNHPQFGYNLQAVLENKPMVADPLESLPAVLGSWKVKDKPFVVSEWNSCWPGDYHQEAPLIMTAYALLHDWDALIVFSFSGKNYPDMIKDNFDIGSMPNILSQMPAMARIFFNEDIDKSDNVLVQNVPDEQVFSKIEEDEDFMEKSYLPLICETNKHYAPSKNFLLQRLTDLKVYYLEQRFQQDEIIFADNKNFYWDLKRDRFVVDNEKVKAVAGFLAGKTIDLKDFSLQLNNRFAAVVLTSLDDLDIKDSSHLLLNISSRVKNNGMLFNQDRTQLTEHGTEPVMVEAVSGNIAIRFKKQVNNAIVYALDFYGYRIKTIKVEIEDRSISFNVDPQDNSLIYEIEVETDQ